MNHGSEDVGGVKMFPMAGEVLIGRIDDLHYSIELEQVAHNGESEPFSSKTKVVIYSQSSGYNMHILIDFL